MQSKLEFQDSAGQADEAGAYFAEVLLPLPLEGTYTYRIPLRLNAQVGIGQRVVVQFGAKKIYTGLLVRLHTEAPKQYIAKYILDILDAESIVHPWQIRFWEWVASYYCSSLGEVMNVALPANMKMQSETKVTLNPEYEAVRYEMSDEEYFVVEALEAKKLLSIQEISDILQQKTVLPIIKSLYEKGYILLKEEIADAYRPKREIMVRHLFEIEDKEATKELFKQLESAPKQSDVLLAYLHLHAKGKEVSRKKLLKQAGSGPSALEGLVHKGILSVADEVVERIQEKDGKGYSYTLNEEQQNALNETRRYFEDRDVVLLHGITGSGKTHIFMELIEETIAKGKQALYLVPEIGLTAQLVQRLRDKFGKKIGIYHSKFNDNERVEIWNKVLHKEYMVVLGVRSALFLPFEQLGLLVIDEEHEHTYKQFEHQPRFHARDAGIYLMALHKGKTILGTATPSFESYFNAQRGKYGLVKLLKRYGNIQLPEIIIADLREEQRKKMMKSHFSNALFTEMNNTMSGGGQVILFQNRRGYAPLLECQNCGWIPTCQNCDISLTYHQAYKQLICHYCGYQEDVPRKCMACGNYSLKMLGFGTEKIEDELQIFFPERKSLRMDQDTTRKKHAYAKIIHALEDGEAQILVGTQMVTKGLDFENVRLVGILSADLLLRYPDFRAVERSYQLMEQVAGRAGRRGIQGKVVIQTYCTEHPVFKFLLAHDYEGFFNAEITERLEYRYPPFYKLIKIVLRFDEQEKVKSAAEWLAARLKEEFGPRVLGAEAPGVARVRNQYLMHILIKFERQNFDMDIAKKHIRMEVENFKNMKEYRKVRVNVDVDPY